METRFAEIPQLTSQMKQQLRESLGCGETNDELLEELRCMGHRSLVVELTLVFGCGFCIDDGTFFGNPCACGKAELLKLL